MKLDKNKVKAIFRTRKFSVLIIPDSTDKNARTRTISNWKFFIIFLCYTLIIAFIGAFVINYTPLKIIIPGSHNVFNKMEMKTINDLNEKIIQLNNDLMKLQNNNSRLKNALRLGDSSLFNKENQVKTRTGGSILGVVRDLIQNIQNSQKEDLFFLKPVLGFLSRNFEPEKGHMGVDFVVKTGTPVYATANGFVIFADYTVKDGYMMIISHPGNYTSIYKHCSSLLKKEREKVIQGEIIALSGNSGEISSGPHLHFEIWNNGRPINPITNLIN